MLPFCGLVMISLLKFPVVQGAACDYNMVDPLCTDCSEIDGECTSCGNGMNLYNGMNCGCPAGTYLDEPTGQCKDCTPILNSGPRGYMCSELESSVLINGCAASFYPNLAKTQCVPCGSPCDETSQFTAQVCDGMHDIQCTACETQAGCLVYAESGGCTNSASNWYLKCSAVAYSNYFLAKGGLVVACDARCAGCSEAKGKCSACKDQTPALVLDTESFRCKTCEEMWGGGCSDCNAQRCLACSTPGTYPDAILGSCQRCKSQPWPCVAHADDKPCVKRSSSQEESDTLRCTQVWDPYNYGVQNGLVIAHLAKPPSTQNTSSSFTESKVRDPRSSFEYTVAPPNSPIETEPYSIVGFTIPPSAEEISRGVYPSGKKPESWAISSPFHPGIGGDSVGTRRRNLRRRSLLHDLTKTAFRTAFLNTIGCKTNQEAISMPSGFDLQLAERIIREQCGLPLRYSWNNKDFRSLFVDECGGHLGSEGGAYHYYSAPCFESQLISVGHSTMVGKALDNNYIYGVFEKRETTTSPDLDACGGHFGPVPESPFSMYHYHLQLKPPFTLGCFGPGKQASTNASSYQSSLAQCQALYPTKCPQEGELAGVEVLEVLLNGEKISYAPSCPCFGKDGKNAPQDPSRWSVLAATGGSSAGGDAVNEDTADVVMIAILGLLLVLCSGAGVIACKILKAKNRNKVEGSVKSVLGDRGYERGDEFIVIGQNENGREQKKKFPWGSVVGHSDSPSNGKFQFGGGSLEDRKQEVKRLGVQVGGMNIHESSENGRESIIAPYHNLEHSEADCLAKLGLLQFRLSAMRLLEKLADGRGTEGLAEEEQDLLARYEVEDPERKSLVLCRTARAMLAEVDREEREDKAELILLQVEEMLSSFEKGVGKEPLNQSQQDLVDSYRAKGKLLSIRNEAERQEASDALLTRRVDRDTKKKTLRGVIEEWEEGKELEEITREKHRQRHQKRLEHLLSTRKQLVLLKVELQALQTRENDVDMTCQLLSQQASIAQFTVPVSPVSLMRINAFNSWKSQRATGEVIKRLKKTNLTELEKEGRDLGEMIALKQREIQAARHLLDDLEKEACNGQKQGTLEKLIESNSKLLKVQVAAELMKINVTRVDVKQIKARIHAGKRVPEWETGELEEWEKRNYPLPVISVEEGKEEALREHVELQKFENLERLARIESEAIVGQIKMTQCIALSLSFDEKAARKRNVHLLEQSVLEEQLRLSKLQEQIAQAKKTYDSSVEQAANHRSGRDLTISESSERNKDFASIKEVESPGSKKGGTFRNLLKRASPHSFARKKPKQYDLVRQASGILTKKANSATSSAQQASPIHESGSKLVSKTSIHGIQTADTFKDSMPQKSTAVDRESSDSAVSRSSEWGALEAIQELERVLSNGRDNHWGIEIQAVLKKLDDSNITVKGARRRIQRARGVLRKINSYNEAKKVALAALWPSLLQELTKMKKPPKGVAKVVLAALLLLGYDKERCQKWSHLTHHLKKQDKVFAKLGESCWATVPVGSFNDVASAVADIDPKAVSAASQGAGLLLDFVMAVLSLDEGPLLERQASVVHAKFASASKGMTNNSLKKFGRQNSLRTL